MVTQIKEYNSAQAIAEALDKEFSETKSVFGEYLRRLDEIRNLAEKSKKVREVVMKLAGKKPNADNPSEITVGNLNIILRCQCIPRVNSHRIRGKKPSRATFGFAKSS